MKKIVLPAALALAVAGSWAFYPKASAESGGYMMVISNCAYKQTALIIIAPDGKSEAIPMPFKGISDSDVSTGLLELQKATLVKLNSLALEGWHINHTSNAMPSSTGSFNVSQTVYVLERNH